MQIGIIGLPNSSKTTIFNALTRGHAETTPVPACAAEVHAATVDVPDPRVRVLSDLFHPRKTTYAQVQYNDIAGLAPGVGKNGGIPGPLLNAINQNDALLHVVRAFEDDTIPHGAGSVDAARDLAALDTELLLSDLMIVEARLERMQKDLQSPQPARREAAAREQALLLRLKEALEAGTPLRDVALEPEEEKELRGFAFLTLKPVLVALNIGDEGAPQAAALAYEHRRTQMLELRGRLEMEIAQMEGDEAETFLHEFGISEPTLSRLIRSSYELLGLQSFFTVGQDEVRAWTVRRGATAVEAADAIHSDLARGFIRAEVVAYDDLIAAGSLAAAKERGHVRLQGKDYVVKDGDILNIRFNV
ncbi:MAG TPA: redox-regulated ATPase YchF [Anaerolineae bacterium]|nr:redox-regulated ATPase YchF [Anaerolineae bacterium]HOR00911.1 redox-regulated ATPase YchF [Anaerolineae bacterium]HPL28378.1 redox-regulated ATPase YchF [Anaerolineae bacterium]